MSADLLRMLLEREGGSLPWEATYTDPRNHGDLQDVGPRGSKGMFFATDRNQAELIVAVVNALPALLAVVEAAHEVTADMMHPARCDDEGCDIRKLGALLDAFEKGTA